MVFQLGSLLNQRFLNNELQKTIKIISQVLKLWYDHVFHD